MVEGRPVRASIVECGVQVNFGLLIINSYV